MNWRGGLVGVVSLLTLLGCGSDFTERGSTAGFKTTLSRLSYRWTPADGIALGSSFNAEMRTECLFCDPLSIDGGFDWTGNQQVLKGSGSYGLQAVGEGMQLVQYRGRDGFSFSVRVEAPASLSIHDPIALTRSIWGHLGTVDGGSWPEFPDVGDEVVMGPDATLLLDIFAHGANGGFLGSSSLFTAHSDDRDVDAFPLFGDSRLVEVMSGADGGGTLSVSLRDGGLERSWPVRIAGPEEVAKLELVAVPISDKIILRALATRSDGGAFLEPPVEWEFSRGVAPETYWGSDGWPARERREVKMVTNRVADGGVVTVSAHAGSASASIDLAFEDLPPPPPPLPPAMPRGCSCTSVEGLALVLATFLLRRRGRADSRSRALHHCRATAS